MVRVAPFFLTHSVYVWLLNITFIMTFPQFFQTVPHFPNNSPIHFYLRVFHIFQGHPANTTHHHHHQHKTHATFYLSIMLALSFCRSCTVHSSSLILIADCSNLVVKLLTSACSWPSRSWAASRSFLMEESFSFTARSSSAYLQPTHTARTYQQRSKNADHCNFCQ